MPTIPSSPRRLALRKSIQQIESESLTHGLRRTLGPVQLMMLGIGSTIGAGIYVMTGTAAANYAGPAILLSFLVAGLACLFTAFSYGELASTMPVSGSAYSYAYVSMGERAAWAVGWLLLLEYGVSCAGVAAGFSGYATSLLHDLGVTVPSFLHASLVQTVPTAHGASLLVAPRLDLVGASSVLLVTFFLVLGVEESARINTLIVFIKVGVLMLFLAVGIHYVHPSYWVPFIPPREGGFHYGVPGIFRAASVIFFAYVGFETVSTASAEARNPRRDVPLGIIGSLLVCTLVYICVAAVLIGIVPYRRLGVADPLAIAVDTIGQPWLAILIKIGAVTGLCSVILGLLYGQTRIFFTIARDGLLPPMFCRLHPKFCTPWIGTIVLGLIVAVATATLPIDIISDLVSLGTATAFGIVCFTVIWQRNTRPDLHRPFSVPLGGVRIGGIWIGVSPALGILFCIIMMVPLFVDMIRALWNGNPLPAILLGTYIVLGVLGYAFYGRSHSLLGRENAAIRA
ncbi:amino acid permease [Gluconacetobacter azotocaptans]|uniref:Amino acid permease n=1 Tax=Gluconacetobacter azotocaptans TaxID=142834 RepID=A0A7W4PFK3_9PROT|nr:amino acid permease [Gluconacetobacter azotocaptans]MBB2190679.1 amino acid permease [Gluconacetobacter azotocaptans]MBM9400925.1 amino acid permease [Gluconacetobacter azotocaptans]GBQ30396.1 amino acid transporter [Gluconacetobacter azotocaptans DSM 13594]